MNRGFRRCFLLSFLLTSGWLGVRPSQAQAPASEVKLTVRVYNYAAVPDGTLTRAEQAAADIFRQAGIRVLWVDCPVSVSELGLYPACAQIRDPRAATLKILPESMAAGYRRPPTQFGITVQPHASFVFFHRVLKLAKDKGLSVPAILSHVVAHELGHLLLGEGNHSDLGIMSEDLRLKEFRQAEKGVLMTFTTEQARLMRAKFGEELAAER